MTMRLLVTISCASLCASLLAAQQPERASLATRDRLTADLARLEAQNNNSARAQAMMIRERLENGDFQMGDRILIRVDSEPQLSDTFTVQAGPALELPQLGTVSLHGVLRAELASHLQTQLARYLRNPVVQVELLVRLLVDGDVARPGYYSVASCPRAAMPSARGVSSASRSPYPSPSTRSRELCDDRGAPVRAPSDRVVGRQNCRANRHDPLCAIARSDSPER